MSGALVSSGGFSNFAQQGSVDWVALSNSSVQFSVAILARLSKAGIDAFTLQFGRAICCNFALDPRAQELVTEAIHKVRKYGSYGDLIWFGFGIKDILTDLADTEEGLTLVALCAALSATYDSMFAAKVIRELCLLCKAPQSFTPAVRQWKTLVDLCVGILASSHFVTLANGFRRLISGHLQLPLETRHSTTTPLALAQAIETLARISKHSLINTTFSGGLDCAWLAAFAEAILSLDVGISHSSGALLYRSRQGVEALPQLTILLRSTAGAGESEVLLRSKASVIPSGQSLLQKDPALRGKDVMNWQSPWSTILPDVFGQSVDRLLEVHVPGSDNSQASAFALYLRCIFSLQRQDSKKHRYSDAAEELNASFANHPVNPLLWNHPDSSGPRFLNFATRRLPELSGHLFDSFYLTRVDFIDDSGSSALETLKGCCQCAKHQRKAIREYASEYDAICLPVLAETIVIFLWILSDCDIDDDVLPSVTGLANLYTWQLPSNKTAMPRSQAFYASVMNCDYLVLGIDLVFHVLSGVSVSGSPPSCFSLPTTDQLARVGNGICVYHYAVEDPALPPETICRLRVVRGYISYSGFRYKDLCGLKSLYMTDSLELEHMQGNAPILSVKTVIQETDEETRLEMAYLLDYIDQDCKRRSHWLHLPFLVRKLQRISRDSICPRGCDGVYDRDRDFDGPFHRNSRGLRLDSSSVDRATQLLTSLKSSTNPWILFNRPYFINIVSGQPVLLYSLMSQSSTCLVPFTDCFKCLVDQLLVERFDREDGCLAVLLTSDKAQVELLIEDSWVAQDLRNDS